MKRAIAMERPLVIEYDEVSFAARLGYQQRDVSEELELMRGARRQMTRILRGLAPADWERQAVHSETGIKTTKQFAQMAVGHVIHHLSFLVEKRKALGVG
jgi:hypothetical protein